MFSHDMYASMRLAMIRCIEAMALKQQHLTKMNALKVLGAESWCEIALHFADITQLAIWNHNKTWIVVPPDIEHAHFASKEELLSALTYVNWTWKYTPKFSKLIENYKLCMLSVGEDIVEGITPVRDLSHFDL